VSASTWRVFDRAAVAEAYAEPAPSERPAEPRPAERPAEPTRYASSPPDGGRTTL
jgi:hypothetical protein